MIFYSFKKFLLFIASPLLIAIQAVSGRKKRICVNVVFYTGKMGDLVCLSPVLRTIKESNKSNKLILIARDPFVTILAHNPYIDQVITFGLDKEMGSFLWLYQQWKHLRKYTIEHYFNLTLSYEANILALWLRTQRKCFVTFNDGMYNSAQKNFSQKILLPFFQTFEFKYNKRVKEFYLDMLALLGMQANYPNNELFFKGTLPEAEIFFKHLPTSRNIIGMSISSGKEYKRWPQEKWIHLAQELTRSYDCIFIFFGSEKERSDIEYVQKNMSVPTYSVVGKPLDVIPYFLKKCSLFISVDTGLSYVADALHVPVVNIMGPVDETQQRPENTYQLITRREICKPLLKTPPLRKLHKSDIHEIKKCYNAISVNEVFVACKEFLK